MNAKRILFINQTASPIGGVETWLDHVVEALQREGWDPLVGLVQGSVAHNPEAFRAHHPTIPTVDIDGRGLNAEGRVRAVMRVIKSVQPEICVPLTVIDAHEAVCRVKSEGVPLKYLQSIRGNVPVQIADAWRYCSWVDLAVCPGALTGQLLLAGGLSAEQLLHIPNGAVRPQQEHLPRKLNAPIRLAYVGRLAGGEKRVADIIPLLDELKNEAIPFTLSVVGEGPLLKELTQAVSDRGLNSLVTFTGRLSQEALYKTVYPDIDVLLLFSESEAFGISLIEAMMHKGVPVSSRYVGYRSEGFLREGETARTFEVGDMRGAAACIAQLSTDEAECRRLGEAACTYVSSRYSWKACCDAWLKAFDLVEGLPVSVGESLPSRLSPPLSRLDKLGLPEAITDFVRRLRICILGVPESQVGGEEWPFAHTFHSSDHLKKIDALSRELEALVDA